MRKYFFTITITLTYCSLILGQLSTLEEPVSFKTVIPAISRNDNTYKSLPSIDMLKIEREDYEDEMLGLPPRFGYPHEVRFNLNNSGEWTELPDGSKMKKIIVRH